MSSQPRVKGKTILLIVFIGLTLVFSSLYFFELVNSPMVISPSSSTETLFTTSTIMVTTSVPFIPDEGSIIFDMAGRFAYKRVESFEVGDSITFRNVTFFNLPLNVTYTGCIVRFIKVTFPDELSEELQVTSCPMSFEPHVQFTNHGEPRVGIIDSYGDSFVAKGIYLLVEN